MASISANRVGYIRGTPGSSFANARQANGSTATDSPTGNVANSIMSFFSSRGRGGAIYLFQRTYLHFDTSGISGTVSSVNLRIQGFSQNSSNAIVMNGNNAFGGDGGTALNVDDFNEVNIGGITQLFSSAVSWSTGVNNISLNSNAESRMQSSDNLTIGILNGTHDFSNSAPTSITNSGIAFGTTITLSYSEAASGGPANLLSYNTIAKSNITIINGITMANITTLNGIS